jgi:MFS family permease
LFGLISTLFAAKARYKRQIYFGLVAIMLFLMISYGIASFFPTIVIIATIQLINSIANAFFDVSVPALIQNQFEQYQQSTVLSVLSMTIMGGLALGGTAEGILLNFVSVNTSYFYMAAAAIIVSAILVPNVLKFAGSLDPKEQLHERVAPPPLSPPPPLN